MTRRTLHRPGVTLTEVLVAMFTMAIGMLSLLTLFPLGAMQVGQALRDDRCRQTALQADAYMRSHWRHNVVEVLNSNNSPIEPYFWAMDDVNLYETPSSGANPKVNFGSGIYLNKFLTSSSTVFQLPTGVMLPRTTANSAVSTTMLTGDIWKDPNVAPVLAAPPAQSAYAFSGTPLAFPSYPVKVDPLGWASPSNTFDQYWVAGLTASSGLNGLLIPRRQLNAVYNPVPNPFAPPATIVNGSARSLEIAGMTDDMSFEKNGAPFSSSKLGRQGRYTWTAIVQRPRNDVRTVANLTILVFDGRPSLPATGDEIVVTHDNPAIGSRTVMIVVPPRTVDQPVLLRKGGWIMDGTIQTTNFTTSQQLTNFYRISGFVEGTTNAAGTTYELDLETPIKAQITATSQLYLFAGLAEVFERPTLKPDSGYYIP